MSESRGMLFIIRAYVDTDHAGKCMTRRSRTRFLIYLNCASVYWFLGDCETSRFGSEFMTRKSIVSTSGD